MSKLIVHLSTVHPATDVRILVKQCASLAKAGFTVTFIVPAGASGVREGVKIRPLKPLKSRLSRFICGPVNGFIAALFSGAKVVHFHDPELLPVGIALKLFGKKVVYDVHEDVPRQVKHKHWIPKPLLVPLGACIEVMEGFSARLFDAIVAATPPIAKRFPARKTVLVQNFPKEEEFMCSQDSIPYLQRENRAVYLGGLSVARGLREIVEAVGLVSSELGPTLHLAGKFMPPEIEPTLKNLPGWKRVVSHGWLGRKQTADLAGTARIGLVTLHPFPSYLESQPVKMYEYMAAGIPIIASDFPLWREIIESANCGILVDPLNPRQIADAIEFLLTNPRKAQEFGENGKRAVRERFNWRIEESKLVQLYSTLTS